MAKNRTCFICGNKYDYCPSCERDKMKPSWYSIFCGDDCNKINDILSANTFKRLTDKEASNLLKEFEFSITAIKNEVTKKRIEELLKCEAKEVKESYKEDCKVEVEVREKTNKFKEEKEK